MGDTAGTNCILKGLGRLESMLPTIFCLQHVTAYVRGRSVLVRLCVQPPTPVEHSETWGQRAPVSSLSSPLEATDPLERAQAP